MQLFPTYYFYLLIDIKFMKILWNIWTVQFTTAPNFFAEDYRKKYGIRETMTYKLVPSENSQYWVNICYKDQSASLSILEFILSQWFGAEEFSKICMRLFQFTLTCIYNEWFHLDALILIDIIVCSYLSSRPTPQSPLYLKTILLRSFCSEIITSCDYEDYFYLSNYPEWIVLLDWVCKKWQ